MDQNSELKENIDRKPTNGNYEPAAELSVATINGPRILLPEFSDLAKSFSQITSQNFELLKMARLPGNDIGTGHEIDSSELQV